MERIIRFYKNVKHEWYADIPEWGGSLDELQMVEGADELLNWIAASATECKLRIADAHFDNAEILDLVYTREENLGGGGDYQNGFILRKLTNRAKVFPTFSILGGM